MPANAPIDIDPERERHELEAYLGSAYDRRRLELWQAQLEAEFAEIGDEAHLYRTSEGYLYNLTAFAMTQTKVPYLRELTRALDPPAALLDYGCGIGSDGLALLEAGYRVSFADFDNPSTRYLRWRLERRGLDAAVYDLDEVRPPRGFDLAFAFDVIEHVEDPHAFLDALEGLADRVLVNFLEPDPSDTELHRELPIRDLLRRCARCRLHSYRRYYGRSHLVLYESEPASGLAGLRSRARLLRGRLAPAR